MRAKRGDSSAEKKALFLLPLSGGGNRSLETLLESSGIWHASNTYVGRRKELIVSSSANKNQETLERLRLDELRQIFHSCLTENDENECFRCLQNMDAKTAEYRARVFVDFERGEEDDEDDEDEKEKQTEYTTITKTNTLIALIVARRRQRSPRGGAWTSPFPAPLNKSPSSPFPAPKVEKKCSGHEKSSRASIPVVVLCLDDVVCAPFFVRSSLCC